MSAVFADTFYWYGLANRRDQWHPLIMQARDRIQGRRILTTEEVLGELLGAMASDPFMRAAGKKLVEAIIADPGVTLVPASHETFLAGFDLYNRRPDKSYSLVDCISMSCCHIEGIRDVLTNDHHFEQEGFAVLITR